MGSIKVIIPEETEERFRKAAMKKFGYGRGAISEAARRAFDEWASRVDFDVGLMEISDPVQAIEGMLKHAKGTSVELQHQAARIRARRKGA